MVCRYCGKEFSDEFEYCPYCAEPKPSNSDKKDAFKLYKKHIIEEKIKLMLFCLIVSSFTIFMHTLLYVAINVIVVIGLTLQGYNDLNDRKRTLIMEQHCLDQTSICPKCGSHNIKIYRKGYNYKIGFWGAIFGVKGAGYAGGFDANNTCCRCMNCGNDWETDYDYRLINK